MTKVSSLDEALGPGAAPASPIASRTAPRILRIVSPVFTRRLGVLVCVKEGGYVLI